jgi:hypothetical protein
MSKGKNDKMFLQRRDAIFRKLTFEGNKISSQAIICLIKNQTDFKAKKKFLRAPIFKRFRFTVAKVNLLLDSGCGFDFRLSRQETHLVLSSAQNYYYCCNQSSSSSSSLNSPSPPSLASSSSSSSSIMRLRLPDFLTGRAVGVALLLSVDCPNNHEQVGYTIKINKNN